MKDAKGRVTVLAVVIAGVVAFMVEKGPYTWGNTAFGLTLLMRGGSSVLPLLPRG